MKFAVYLLLCTVLSEDVFGQETEGDACTDNDNKRGVCKPINQCVQATDDFKNNKTIPTICGYVQTEAVVCCPDASSVDATVANITEDIVNNTKTTNYTRIYGEISKAKCKEYAKYSYRSIVSPLLSTKPQHEKIYDCHKNLEILSVDSLKASRKECPHMAHVGFLDKNNEIIYRCGGSLISELFVITTANCILNKGKYQLLLVRFGVTNTDDHEHRQEIKISEYFAHPKYSVPYHDIGLLKLEKPVEINEFVRPACLNTVRDINYKTGVVPGWGQKKSSGEPAKNLLKSVLDIVANEPCNEIYSYISTIHILDDFMICAAITSNQRWEACESAGGAPLQERIQNSEELQCMSLIIGITSFGPQCLDQVGVPGVYTRVSAYIDWIEKIIWPDL